MYVYPKKSICQISFCISIKNFCFSIFLKFYFPLNLGSIVCSLFWTVFCCGIKFNLYADQFMLVSYAIMVCMYVCILLYISFKQLGVPCRLLFCLVIGFLVFSLGKIYVYFIYFANLLFYDYEKVKKIQKNNPHSLCVLHLVLFRNIWFHDALPQPHDNSIRPS